MTTKSPEPISMSVSSMEDIQKLFADVKTNIALLEKCTGKIMTAGNAVKYQPAVKFGHGVFSTLFWFPFHKRGLDAQLARLEEDESGFLVPWKAVVSINTFVSKLSSNTRIPFDRLYDGERLYKAWWENWDNVPCLIRRLEDSPGFAESVSSDDMKALKQASDTLSDLGCQLNDLWKPFRHAGEKVSSQWLTDTPEGQAHKARLQKAFEEITVKK